MRRSSVYFAVGAFVALLVLASVLALVMTTSHKNAPVVVTVGGETPEASVQQSLALIKAGDFANFWKHALPPADYETLRADWARPRPDEHPISPEDRADFIRNMQQLTAPDAETRLYAAARPKLAQLQQQYHDQLPVMIGIGQAIAATGIAQSKELTNLQKQQATEAINVLAPWAQRVAWFDQAKAKQAIAIVVATARKLDIQTPEQLHGMDFDTAMQKYSAGFLGIKQVLGLYGLSIDQILDSVRISPIESRNGHARVRIDYILLGKPLSTESSLVEQDGRWYSEDMLKNVRDAHDRLVAPPAPGESTAPAPATSAPGQPTRTASGKPAMPSPAGQPNEGAKAGRTTTGKAADSAKDRTTSPGRASGADPQAGTGH
ncbi:hypothetical protein ACXU4B_15875 [Dyella soli]|uniref:Uncharacterized protein n=1 Tax=Dyella soli TaxID=522319 RepID=A0A4R0YQY4_9GAMM|nr:hypothetical protein [Dyella soli]TCI08885.1 hypothetical protein EZM97_21800 [Dyella soli]